MQPENQTNQAASVDEGNRSDSPAPDRAAPQRVQGEIHGMTPRQQAQLRHLIIGEPNLSAEFKELAHYDLPLLIRYFRATSGEVALPGNSPESYSVEIQKRGFSLPSSSELKELGEIFAEISYLSILSDSQGAVMRRIANQYAVSDLDTSERDRARTALSAFGAHRDMSQLALKFPKLFNEYLLASERCDARADDASLQEARSEIAARIRQAGLHVPLDREIRKYRQQERADREESLESEELLRQSQKLLADFSAMTGLERDISRGMLNKFGLENVLFRLSVEMPDEFRRYVQLAHQVGKSPGDTDSADIMRELESSIREHGMPVPKGKLLTKCLWILESAIADDRARLARAAQSDMDDVDILEIPIDGLTIEFGQGSGQSDLSDGTADLSEDKD